MFDGVYHIGYLVDDVDKAISFYEATFGGELVGRSIAGDGISKMAFIRCGETEVELIQPGDPARLGGRTGLIIDHVGYEVADIDAAVAELREKGVQFAAPAPHVNSMGARLIYLDSASTMGTRVHLTQR
ncbi:MAG TPA: VOC family protein [Chloroflexota bacterium]|nr:VOC family protein [Chloroflexota bacterium]